MGIFENLTTGGFKETADTLGGSFDPKPSAAYDAVITMAYAGKSSRSNAQSITVHATIDGAEFKETIWVTNGKGENFYLSKDGKNTKNPLPGFTTVDDLCLLATGSPLAEQSTEEKAVKIYDYEARKEVPKQVQVLVDLLGKEVKLGVLREIVDKTKQADSGQYLPTGETRTQNVINKVFHGETGRTVNEYRHEIAEPDFLAAWKLRNDGKDRNRAKGIAANGAGASGAGRPAGAAPAKKLFG